MGAGQTKAEAINSSLNMQTGKTIAITGTKKEYDLFSYLRTFFKFFN